MSLVLITVVHFFTIVVSHGAGDGPQIMKYRRFREYVFALLSFDLCQLCLGLSLMLLCVFAREIWDESHETRLFRTYVSLCLFRGLAHADQVLSLMFLCALACEISDE